MKTLLIIPAYNEAGNILKTMQAVIDWKAEHMPDLDYVIINDGSSDDTLSICQKSGFQVINLFSNLGVGGAVQTGYRYAALMNYDVAVQFDGDGQHDITSLPELLEPFTSRSADFVIGSRFISKTNTFHSTVMRRLGGRWLTYIIYLCTGRRFTDPTSGYRAAGKDVIQYFAEQYPEDYPEPETLVDLIRQGFTLVEAPVRMRPRGHGVSSIGALRSTYYMIKVSLAIFFQAFRGTRR